MRTPLQLDLERAVRAYVAAATGIPSERVIPGNDNHPAPNMLYATVLFMNRQKNGLDALYAQKVDGNVNYAVRGSRVVNFSVQFYRSPAVFDAAEALIGFSDTPQGQLILGQLGLVFKDAGDAKNLSKIMSDQFEQRAQVDLSFSVAETEAQIIPSIVSADIGILEESGSKIIEDEVSVQT